MTDTVADQQRDAPVVQVGDVVPVTPNLQRTGGRLVAHRKTVRQIRRAQDGMLQGQGGLTLLVDLINPLQALAEPGRQHGEQGLVLEGEGPSFGQIDPHDEHALGMLQGDGRRSRPGRVGGKQAAFA